MISYAQNFEDVVLNRIFKSKSRGFYIDVGAHDPVDLSVTKFFYDLGWRGINIDPVPANLDKFRRERPDEINLGFAIGSRHDFVTIYEIEGHSELSTLDYDTAVNGAKIIGGKIIEYTVELRTLSDVCEQYCHELIDFMNIDVEGNEHDVILSADWKKYRPTMLVIESTAPCTVVDLENPNGSSPWNIWEPVLLDEGYSLVYRDALNRYYLRKEDSHLRKYFSLPISPLQDGFLLYRDIRHHRVLQDANVKLRESLDHLSRSEQELKQEVVNVTKNREVLDKRVNDLTEGNQRLEHKLSMVIKEKETLGQKITDLSEGNQRLEHKLSMVIKEKETLGQKVTDLSEGNRRLEHELSTVINEKEALGQKVTDLSEGNRRLEHELSTVINEKEALGQKVNDLSESNQRLKHELDEVIEERKALDQKANELSQDSLRLNKELSREKETIRNKDLVLGVLRATLEEERFVNKRSLFKRLMSSFPLTSLLTVYPGFSSSDGQSGGDPPLQKTSDSPDDAKCDSATSPSVPFLLSPPGWEMILRAIEEVVGDKALRIIPCVDTFFACHGAEISEDWIGFLHTPQHLPKFWLETIRSYGIKRESILNIEYLDRYRHHCKGIITFSQNHAQMLQKLSGLNIKKVTYPLINTKTRWSWKRFKNNPHKKIIQIGWWLQRMHAIYMLPESDYEKVYIKNFSSFADEVFEKERKEAEQKRTFSGSMEHSVSHIEKASRREYFNILKENIAFVHYHDVTLPGLVLDCIATGTPVLVNALPSVLEYLGKDYPLYYYSYADAIEKAKDDTLIRKAHDHLKRLHQNTEFQMKHFVSEIQMLLPEES